MADRTQLSSHTWLSDGYLYTTSREVGAAWPMKHVEFEWPNGGPSEKCFWRIPIRKLPEVYGYCENEPFVWVTGFVYVGHEAERDMDIDAPMLHLRAIIPCDGSADSLRALYEEVRNDHGE